MVEDFVKIGNKGGIRKQKLKGHVAEKKQRETKFKLMSDLSPKLKCKGLALLSTFLSFRQIATYMLLPWLYWGIVDLLLNEPGHAVTEPLKGT